MCVGLRGTNKGVEYAPQVTITYMPPIAGKFEFYVRHVRQFRMEASPTPPTEAIKQQQQRQHRQSGTMGTVDVASATNPRSVRVLAQIGAWEHHQGGAVAAGAGASSTGGVGSAPNRRRSGGKGRHKQSKRNGWNFLDDVVKACHPYHTMDDAIVKKPLIGDGSDESAAAEGGVLPRVDALWASPGEATAAADSKWVNMVVPYNNFTQTELPVLSLAVAADCTAPATKPPTHKNAAAAGGGGEGSVAGRDGGEDEDEALDSSGDDDDDGDGEGDEEPKSNRSPPSSVPSVERMVGGATIPLYPYIQVATINAVLLVPDLSK